MESDVEVGREERVAAGLRLLLSEKRYDLES